MCFCQSFNTFQEDLDFLCQCFFALLFYAISELFLLVFHVADRKKHVCEICGHSFSKLCNLKSHIRVHNGERPYSCDLCSKAFTNYWDLRRHCRTHSGEKPYKVRFDASMPVVIAKKFSKVGFKHNHAQILGVAQLAPCSYIQRYKCDNLV